MPVLFSSIELISIINLRKIPKPRGQITKPATERRVALWATVPQSRCHQQGGMFELLRPGLHVDAKAPVCPL